MDASELAAQQLFQLQGDLKTKKVLVVDRHPDARNAMRMMLSTLGIISVQGVGSSLSYGKRYTAYALLNITTSGDDDDGRSGGTAYITEEQVGQLQELIESTGADKARFLKFIGAESLTQIPADRFTKAMQALLQKASK